MHLQRLKSINNVGLTYECRGAASSTPIKPSNIHPNETNDCTVRALAIAADLSYTDAHAIA